MSGASTTKLWPVTNWESSEARNTTASATFLGLNTPPFKFELNSTTLSTSSSFSNPNISFSNGVPTAPGETQFTRIPYEPTCKLADLTNPNTACFDIT
ncbi:hypothetical protein CFP56_040153 [Quercus suber]|uniref:Uncharacterized protein n=1 Tax=Quercus suber TaxID=58331 RepID=A0AAW0IYN0_QUESU